MEFSKEEQAISDEAIKFAKKNKKSIARRITNPKIFLPEDKPVSVFMAGSPGAGKTEASKALIDRFSGGFEVLRIDPDELRSKFEAYTGDNSWLFQGATSILVSKVLDFAYKQSQSFLLDGTLSHYEVAVSNIRRSIGRGRHTQILYVYQSPLLAWKFVLARELVEGRKILPEHFIEQYFAARGVVNKLKEEFGKELQVDLLLKDIDGKNKVYRDNIDCIDNHVPEKYTRARLATDIRLS